MQPVPVAIRLPSDVTLRGHEWSVDGAPMVFIHDLGDDLDAWEKVTSDVARAGFRVMSIELRGHGLSDGDPDPATVRQDVKEVIGEITRSFGPVAVVSYGSASEALLYLDTDDGAPVSVIISPQPLDIDGIDREAHKPAMRMLIGGTLNKSADAYLKQIYPKLRGQKLLVTAAGTEQGPALLTNHASLLEQLVVFVRRYLTGYHLAWIADHADQITEAAKQRRVKESP